MCGGHVSCEMPLQNECAFAAFFCTIAAADFAERERDLKLGEEHLSIAKQQLKIDQDLLKIQQQKIENEAKQKADAVFKERFSKNLERARNDWFAQLALHQIHLQKADK